MVTLNPARIQMPRGSRADPAKLIKANRTVTWNLHRIHTGPENRAWEAGSVRAQQMLVDVPNTAMPCVPSVGRKTQKVSVHTESKSVPCFLSLHSELWQ